MNSMRLLRTLPLIASLVAGSAVASTITVDYITPFTASSGLSALSLQVGEVVTVPTAYLHLDSFSLVASDQNNASLEGQVQIWDGSNVGATYRTPSLSRGLPKFESDLLVGRTLVALMYWLP